MLTISGQVLDVTSEWVKPNTPDAFESITIYLLTGSGAHTKNEGVRVGRDFPKDRLAALKSGDRVTLGVFISAFATRNGAGYRLTADTVIDGAAVKAA